MLLHPITFTAVLCPLLAYLLCRRYDLLDPLTFSTCEAAAFSLSGVLMWLRSRYLASLYLRERQARKTAFVTRVRREVDDSNARSDATSKETVEQQQQQGTARTVARAAPIGPAFLACCFVLLSFYGLMSAVLHVIWFVRSEGRPP